MEVSCQLYAPAALLPVDLQIMKLLTVQFPAIACCFLFLRCKFLIICSFDRIGDM